MSAGDRWHLPDGRDAIELSGSQGGLLRVAPLVDGWPFPAPPLIVMRCQCERMPSRYLRGATPEGEE